MEGFSKCRLRAAVNSDELSFRYQLSLENPLPRVLDEVEPQHSTPVTWRVYVDQRIHADVEQPQLSQNARHPETNGPIDAVQLGVGVQDLQETSLGVERRIASATSSDPARVER